MTVPSPVSPFAGYSAPLGVHDELIGSDGQPRPHWWRLAAVVGEWQPDALVARWEQARKLIRENGVTYNVHDETSGEQRPWVLDPIPLIIAADDWARLEAGIAQRHRLLDALLADLYGPQTALHAGIVPAELVLGHPAYLRACHGMQPPGGRWLHLHGTVVARHPDGRWVALGDRTGVPRGLGYALENRLVVSRLLPEAFRECQVARLAPFFIGVRAMLRWLAPGRDNPRIALASPGPHSATSFEDAYLARYLGYTLVEGGDLAVRDDRVSLKTLGGLVPMDVLLRRVADRECDPLELDSTALAGTPGLVQAARQGRVAIANALGSGLAESPGFTEFLPALARHLLGEELLLESPRSWWCGVPDNLERVLAGLDGMVIEPVTPVPGTKRFVAGLLDASARAELVERVRRHPQGWVGRQVVDRSVAPCWNGTSIAPAAVLVRCFSAATPDGPSVMPGGLARMSVGRTGGEESLLSGHGSKDVWVLSAGPVAPVSLLRPPGQPVPLRRSGHDLPSRVADHLHWLGRHVERAEGAARLLRAVAVRVASENNLESAAAVAHVLAALTDPPMPRREWLEPGRAATPGEVAAELHALVFAVDRPGSVAASIASLWRMASVVRDRISIDSWKILARVRRDGQGDPQALRAGNVSAGADLLSILDTIILDLSAFAGLGTESMTRGPGWRFLDMGRRLERASAMGHLLGATGAAPGGTALATDEPRLLEMLLEIADSSMTYRNRYLGVLEAAPVIDLLVIDETNPRSIGFQIAALDAHAAALPHDEASPVLSPERRSSMAALAAVRLADVTALSVVDGEEGRPALTRLLSRLEAELRDFSDGITHRYLVHATPRRRLGDPLDAADVRL
jgi:uncharacterized circularly permuted ATP-grasp superfamily protein/uncharacterized alpha-E superfamily protein